MMRISELFKDISAVIPAVLEDKRVENIHYDSRKISSGDLFVAVEGFNSDGHTFLSQVQSAGAVAAVVERKVPGLNLPQIKVEDTRLVMAVLAYRLNKNAIDNLKLIGITGTNGKTSTAFLVQSILNVADYPAGLLGTIAYYVGGKEIPAWNTTPEALDICGMLADMFASDHKAAVLEVSSHALALNRVDGLRFDVGIFTNLSRDHLDFHKTEQDYFEAKSHLFALLKRGGTAVLNLDDPNGRKLAQSLCGNIITYGFEADAMIRISGWKGDIDGLRIELQLNNEIWNVRSKLVGTFNVSNITASVAAGVALGLAKEDILKGVLQLEFVAGRLQAYPLQNDATAIIDYAHTPDALEKAIQAVKEITRNRLIVVFGAGGDRDKGKRPLMGRVAEDLADVVIVTTDNPRTEKPKLIIEDILAGMKKKNKRIVVVNRSEAIQRAIQMTNAGDVVLIAGKGHEAYQDINGVKHDFNEPAIVMEAAAHV